MVKALGSVGQTEQGGHRTERYVTLFDKNTRRPL